MRTIIGFAGLIGSGKTTAAMQLIREYNFRRVRFATPLKAMMRSLGLTNEEVDGKLKELPCDLLCGKTPRWAQQSIGTEWGRELIGEAIWTNAWQRSVNLLPPHAGVVADDVRFANEAEIIRSLGGAVIRIDRPGVGLQVTPQGSHASEAIAFDVDAVIVNDSTEAALLDKIRMTVRGMLKTVEYEGISEAA